MASFFFTVPIKHLSTWTGFPSAFSRGLTASALSASPCLKMLQLLNHLHSLSMESLRHVHVSSTEEPSTGHSTPDLASPGLCNGQRSPPLTFWQHFCSCKEVIGFLYHDDTCQLIVVLPSTKTLKSFSTELLSSQLVTSVYWCLGLFLIVQLP